MHSIHFDHFFQIHETVNDEVGLRLQAELPKVLPNWKVLSLTLETEGAKPVA
jgi:hypothetical protein